MSRVTASVSRPRIVLATTLAVFLSAGVVHAQWKPIGPYTRVGTRKLVLDPSRPGAIFAVTTARTVLRSSDYGATWKSGDLGLGASDLFGEPLSVCVDPTIPGRLYAVRAGNFYISTDSARQWKMISGLRMGGPSVRELLVVPSQPAVLYLRSADRLSRSSDHGVTWQPTSTVEALPPDVFITAVSAARPDILYVLTDARVIHKSTDRGATWHSLSSNIAGSTRWSFRPTLLLVDQSDPDAVYVAGEDLFKTTAGGTSWTKLRRPADEPGRSEIRHLEINRGILYYGNQVSRDGGQTWEAEFPDLGPVLDVAFDSRRPGVMYMATDDGAFVKADNVSSWSALLMPPNRITDIMVDRQDRMSIYVGASTQTDGKGEVFRMKSGAGTWQESEAVLPKVGQLVQGARASQVFATGSRPGVQVVSRYSGVSGVSSTSTVAFESTDWGRTWVKVTHSQLVTALARDPSNPGVRFAGCAEQLCKSVDGGMTYQPTGVRLQVMDIAIDPENSRIVYACGVGQGDRAVAVYKSVDDGQTWEESAQGFEGAGDRILINPANRSLLLLVNFMGRLFRSTNAAVTWAPIGEDFGITKVFEFLADLTRSEVIYAFTNRGLAISPDYGSTWTVVDPQPPGHLDLTCMAVDSGTPRTIYMGTRGDGVWKLSLGSPASAPRSRSQPD